MATRYPDTFQVRVNVSRDRSSRKRLWTASARLDVGSGFGSGSSPQVAINRAVADAFWNRARR